MLRILLLSTIFVMFLTSLAFASDIELQPSVVFDVMYDTIDKELVPVVSFKAISFYDDLGEMRIMFVSDNDNFFKFSKVGLGLGVNVLKLTDVLGIKSQTILNPVIGVTAIYSVSKKKTGIGVYMSIVKLSFD